MDFIIDNGTLTKIIKAEGVADIEIPPEVKRIGRGLFINCSFNTVYIPDSVIYLDDKAFEGSEIRKLYLPNHFAYKADVFENDNHTHEIIVRERINPSFYFDFCEVKVLGRSPSDEIYEDGAVFFPVLGNSKKQLMALAWECDTEGVSKFPVGEYISIYLWLLGSGHAVEYNQEPYIQLKKNTFGLRVEGIGRICCCESDKTVDIESEGLVFELETLKNTENPQLGMKIAFEGYFKLDLND